MASNRVNKTTDGGCSQGQNMPLALDPWGDILQSENPHSSSRKRSEKGQFLSDGMTGVEGLHPQSEVLHSQSGSSQLRRSSHSKSPSPILSTYSESTNSRGYESGNSPPPTVLEYDRAYYRHTHESSYALSSVAPGTSPSSAGDFARPTSGGHEFAFGRAVDSTESLPYVSTSEHECSDFGAPGERMSGRAGGQGAIAIRPRPFSRKSKAGTQHTVTPSAAGPEGGFVCSFVTAARRTCGESFKLPSDIRSHLIEKHMTFSPFQCENCKRVYTRKSLYTRHLKEIPGAHRQCPNRQAGPDEAFYVRKETYTALWAIQVTQAQVDQAVRMINQHNGILPSRRRRTPNVNENDQPERRPALGPSAGPGLDSPGESPQHDPTPRSPPYLPHAYPVSHSPFTAPGAFHDPPNYNEHTPPHIIDDPYAPTQPPFGQPYPNLPEGDHIDPGVLRYGSWSPPARMDYRFGANPHAQQQRGFKDGYQFQTGRSEDTHYNAHSSRSRATKRFSPKGGDIPI